MFYPLQIKRAPHSSLAILYHFISSGHTSYLISFSIKCYFLTIFHSLFYNDLKQTVKMINLLSYILNYTTPLSFFPWQINSNLYIEYPKISYNNWSYYNYNNTREHELVKVSCEPKILG